MGTKIRIDNMVLDIHAWWGKYHIRVEFGETGSMFSVDVALNKKQLRDVIQCLSDMEHQGEDD